MPTKEEYNKRYEAGLCVQCGKNKRVDFKTTCRNCLDKNRDRARKVREERAKKGLCPRCGNVSDNGNKNCKSCNEKLYIQTKKNREYCKSILICGNCQRNSIPRVGVICVECREKAKKYNKLTEEQKKIKSKKHKERNDLRKEQGICIDCGKRKAEQGKVRCIYCLQRNLKSQRKYLENKFGVQLARSDRSSYGLCYFCGEKLDNNTKICSKCRERCNKSLSKVSMQK